jgi:hypothetical protein
LCVQSNSESHKSFFFAFLYHKASFRGKVLYVGLLRGHVAILYHVFSHTCYVIVFINILITSHTHIYMTYIYIYIYMLLVFQVDDTTHTQHINTSYPGKFSTNNYICVSYSTYIVNYVFKISILYLYIVWFSV